MSAGAATGHAQPLFESGTGEILEVVTPEGVPLHFKIATGGARIGAVVLDYLIISAALIVFMIGFAISGVVLGAGMALALIFVGSFLLLNFYFTIFEIRWQGATPGKRATGIRVINRSGGPVTGDAILTRNFLRVVEVFVPLQMFIFLVSGGPAGVPWYFTLLGVLWAFLLLFLPLFNKQRLRLGDIAGGTVVVEMPRGILLQDQGREGARGRKGRASSYVFTREQLDVYGEYELQVLEELLRNVGRADRHRTLDEVADKITKKIDYRRKITRREKTAFLQAFYEALRAHRERQMLFGRRKKDKHADS